MEKGDHDRSGGSNSRDRDRNREYESGSKKRAKKKKTEKMISELPKITSMFTRKPAASDSQSESDDMQTPSSSSSLAEPTTTLHHDDTCPDSVIPAPYDDSDIPCAPPPPPSPNDIGLWPSKISDAFCDYWLERGSKDCRNSNSDFANSAVRETDRDGFRHCNASLFKRKHKTGEILDISWLCYSESTGKLYCFPCKLLSSKQSLFTSGFQDWKHAGETIESHRKSPQHRASLEDAVIRSKTNARVDNELVKEMQVETNYWRAVLTRVIDVLVLLAARGLAIRGSDEKIGSVHNGNFLGIIELLSKYDAFLAAHLEKYGNKGSGSTSYLSHSICDELIKIMANKVMDVIIKEVQEAKYYSISVDSTPDITHTDQLSITIRYVLPRGPVEHFLTYVPISTHTGEGIADVVLDFLRKKSVDVQYLRGQSYDNASNMSGKYKGVQQRIKCVCSYADYVPCCAHSLNLVGTCAVESDVEAAGLFSLIQKVYTFFSASTKLWKKEEDMLAQHDDKLLVVKRLADTRWSARHNAVRALTLGYKKQINLLEEISMSDENRGEVRAEARGLVSRLRELETAILLQMWNVILDRVNKTSVMLQKEGLPLNTAVQLLESLLSFIDSLRDQYQRYETLGQEQSGTTTYRKEKRRQRNIKRFFDEIEASDSVDRSPGESFRTDHYIPIIDQLRTSLRARIEAYRSLGGKFGFLLKITTLTNEELRDAAINLIKHYPKDLEAELEPELIQFASLIKGLVKAKVLDLSKGFEIGMYEQIRENDLNEAFPNVCIMFKIYLCMFVTNCKGERSFSKLKLILNYLRNTMGQDRLVSLALLSIENELLKTIDFTTIIGTFAREKSRRKDF